MSKGIRRMYAAEHEQHRATLKARLMVAHNSARADLREVLDFDEFAACGFLDDGEEVQRYVLSRRL